MAAPTRAAPGAAAAARAPHVARARAFAALVGIFVGDAVAMPVHWFYDPRDIRAAFPPRGLTGHEAAPAAHPGSIMALSSTGGAGRGGQGGDVVGDVINHGKKELWGRRGVHYHHGMAAGENTLNAVCARVLLRCVAGGAGQEGGGGRSAVAGAYDSGAGAYDSGAGAYDSGAWLRDYVAFMTTPGSHNDVYAESYHRMFFASWARGVPPERCAGDDNHNIATIGGLVSTPVAALAGGVDAAVAHQRTTHASRALERYTRLYARTLLNVVRGADLRKETAEAARELGVDVAALAASGAADEAVVQRLGAACYIDGALPVCLYFSHKYAGKPREGVLANANAGGENAHRGACVGALLGAGYGEGAWEDGALLEGLAESAAIVREVDSFLDAIDVPL